VATGHGTQRSLLSLSCSTTQRASVPTPAIPPYPNYHQHDDLGGR
jgi:hypothetical protein